MDVDAYATREPTFEERHTLREAVFSAARTLACALAPADAPLCEMGDTTVSEHEQRRAALAMVHALTIAAADLERFLLKDAAHYAGEAGATYADIGAAAGISRQAARTRWPGAVPHARPGRPPLPTTTQETIRNKGASEDAGIRAERNELRRQVADLRRERDQARAERATLRERLSRHLD